MQPWIGQLLQRFCISVSPNLYLSSSSEKVVQAALDEIMSDSSMTCVTIAHRLSTIRGADRIAVVGHGRVREIGTHEELMAKDDGLYRKMQSLQSLEAGSVVQKPKETSNEAVKADEMKKSSSSVTATIEETDLDIDKEQEAGNAKRARELALSSIQYFVYGGVGACKCRTLFLRRTIL